MFILIHKHNISDYEGTEKKASMHVHTIVKTLAEQKHIHNLALIYI